MLRSCLCYGQLHCAPWDPMRHEEATSRINTCCVHNKYSPYSLDSSLIKPVKSDHSAFYNRLLHSVEMEA